MVWSGKPTGKASSLPMGLTIGCVVSMGFTLLAAALLAWLINSEKLAWENVGYGIMVGLLLASFTGAAVASAKVKHRRLLVCLLTGGCYILVLLCCTVLFFGGQYAGAGVTALLVLGGSGTAGLLSLRESSRSRGSAYRKRARK